MADNRNNQGNKPRIKIIKIDNYDLGVEEKQIAEIEDQGYTHYAIYPCSYGTGKLFYFRKKQ
jgi:hypothetical protein